MERLLVVKNKVKKYNLTWFNVDTKEWVDDSSLSSYPAEKLGVVLHLDYTMIQVQTTSLQDIHGDVKYLSPENKEELRPYLVKNTESAFARNLLAKDTAVIDGREGLMVEFGGFRPIEIYAANSMNFFKDEFICLDGLYNLTAGFAGPGHKRSGSHGILSSGTDHYTYVDSIGLDIESFVKHKIINHIEYATYNAKKIGTRVFLANSSVEIVPMFEGYKYVTTTLKTYKYKGQLVTAERHEFYNIDLDDNKIMLVLPEDFTVETTEEIFGSIFNGNKAEFGNFKAELDKVATDGSAYISPEWAKYAGLEHTFTFRFAQVTKGLMQPVPLLKKYTGADMILFGGAVKADIKPYLYKQQLDFGVIMHARLQDSRLFSMSRQAAKRLLTQDVFKQYHELTRTLIQSVIELDMETIKSFLSMGKDLTEEELNEKEPEDLMIVDWFWSNEEDFLTDLVLRNRLRSFLKKQLEKYISGERIIVTETVWRHMVSDPFTVIRELQKGNLSVKREELKRGIGRGHSFTIVNGEVDTREVVLVRFPFPHKYSGRKSNVEEENAFLDKETENYYSKFSNYFKGMQVYSLADMTAEAQEGADFDGDTTAVIFNQTIINDVKEHPLFLDASLVDGEVVLGAPFEDVTPIKWQYLSQTDIAVCHDKGIKFDSDGMIYVPKELEHDSEVLRIVWKSIASVSMESLQPGYVGKFSNVSDTVVEYMTTVKDKDILAGLELLNSYLTSAIRWEIDKAKHGGAFLDALPFLRIILHGTPNMQEIVKYEKEFGVVLKPFFKLRKSGLYCFNLSLSLFYGEEDYRKNRLWIDSMEHAMICGHVDLANSMFQIVAEKESAIEYNLYSYAKELIQEGLSTGKLLASTVDAYNWANVESNQFDEKTKYLKLVIEFAKRLNNVRQAIKFGRLDEGLGEIQMYALRKDAVKMASGWDMGSHGAYIMALMYVAITDDQYTKSERARKGNFRISHLSDMYSYFPKATLEFLQACKTVKGTVSKEGTEVRFLMNTDYQVSVGEQLVLGHGRVNAVINNKLERIALVNLRDIKEGKALTGVLKVTKVETTKNGNTVIVGSYINYKK